MTTQELSAIVNKLSEKVELIAQASLGLRAASTAVALPADPYAGLGVEQLLVLAAKGDQGATQRIVNRLGRGTTVAANTAPMKRSSGPYVSRFEKAVAKGKLATPPCAGMTRVRVFIPMTPKYAARTAVVWVALSTAERRAGKLSVSRGSWWEHGNRFELV